MKQVMLHTPEGVRDIYNGECAQKFALQEKLHGTLAGYGYRDIETPTFEYFDVFGNEVGTISARELYKFFDREGNTLVLRPDITPSVARSAAKYFMEETQPIRLCYMGNTFINHSSYQGRLRETTQMGAELIGDASVDADAELIAMAVECLQNAGLKDFQVSVGQIDFFKSLLEEAGIDEETEEELRELISNKNHFGIEELIGGCGISPDIRDVLLRLPELFGSAEILDTAMGLTENAGAKKAVERLKSLHQVLECYGVSQYVSFDLGMLNKYHYYTGVIFRAYTYGTGDAVLKGGRYDRLLAHFGKDAPSIGFAIVIDQLQMALARQKIGIPIPNSLTLLLYPQQLRTQAISLARGLRAAGTKVELSAMREGISRDEYFAYAKRSQAGGVLYLESEDEVTMKAVSDGEERAVKLSALMGGSQL